jgi:hypothetical protein
MGRARGLAPPGDWHQRGELVRGPRPDPGGRQVLRPECPRGRQEDDLWTQPGLRLAPAVRWRHGPGVTCLLLPPLGVAAGDVHTVVRAWGLAV